MIKILFFILTFPFRVFLYLYNKITYFFTKEKILFLRIPQKFTYYEKVGLINLLQELEEENYFDFLLLLRNISQEKKIKKVIVYVPSLEELSWNVIEELIQLIHTIRENKKEVYTYLEGGGIKSLLVASTGNFRYSGDWNQFSVTLPFFDEFYLGDFLKNLGIEVEIFSAGKYKSAGEIFSRNTISKYAKENYFELLNVQRNLIYQSFLEQKHLSEDTINKMWNLFKNQSIVSSLDLYKIGFFNELIEYVQLKEYVNEGSSKNTNNFKEDKLKQNSKFIKQEKKIEKNIIEREDFIKIFKKKEFVLFPFTKKKIPIALVVMDGIITMGEEGSPRAGTIKAKSYAKILQELKDSKERVVLIYLNSPGGMSDASEILYQEIGKLSRTKPVYILQGSVAASGGYYISCAANKIFSNKFTITGSIGVLRIRPNLKKLYKKYKINKAKFLFDKTTEIFSEDADLKKDSKLLLQNTTYQTYEIFLDRVARGRKIEKENLKKFAEGRVFSSVDFQKNGLIDKLATFYSVLDEIKKDLNLHQEKIVLNYYPKIKFDFRDLLNFKNLYKLNLSLAQFVNLFYKEYLISLDGLAYYLKNNNLKIL